MRRLSLLTALSAVLALAGCGGSSTVSLSSYVKSVCTTLAPMQRQLSAKLQALAAASLQSPEQGKKAFEDFLSTTASVTDATAAKLKSIGTPSGSNGKEISAQFVRAFSTVSSRFKQATAAAQSMPTSNPAAFRAAERRIGTNIQTSLEGLQSSFSVLRTPQLDQAVKHEPACLKLSSSG
jgi:hypothetical protein